MFMYPRGKLSVKCHDMLENAKFRHSFAVVSLLVYMFTINILNSWSCFLPWQRWLYRTISLRPLSRLSQNHSCNASTLPSVSAAVMFGTQRRYVTRIWITRSDTQRIKFLRKLAHWPHKWRDVRDHRASEDDNRVASINLPPKKISMSISQHVRIHFESRL